METLKEKTLHDEAKQVVSNVGKLDRPNLVAFNLSAKSYGVMCLCVHSDTFPPVIDHCMQLFCTGTLHTLS